MESQADPSLRDIHNRAGLVTPMACRWCGSHGSAGITTYSECTGRILMLACCEASVRKGYRHFFYGGGPGVAERLAKRLAERFDGLQIVGTWSPPFRDLTARKKRQ
jgi:N-acetylglucosaminyldiphosphoundecaprenol N-acetyl-beta-D-mannosaminyltransferase